MFWTSWKILDAKNLREMQFLFIVGGNLVILGALGPISGPKNLEKTRLLGFFEASWARMGILGVILWPLRGMKLAFSLGRCAKHRKLAMLS